MKSAPSIFLGLAVLQGLADAAHLPFIARSSPSTSGLVARSNILGDTGPLNDVSDMSYFTNITLGGQTYTVLIDTGSSDLWVSGDKVPNSVNTGQTASVQYAVGQAEGPIMLAELGFEGYTVEKQAFFFATESADQLPAAGIIGLGPFIGSVITNTLTNGSSIVQGLPPLDNIFSQNTTTPNFLTVLLGRVSDPDDNYPGDLTIMDILPGYEDILSQPQLPVTVAQNGNQHWSTLLDQDGFIGPDGQPISVKTDVKETKNNKQLTIMFDTGFTYPQITTSVAETIYGSFNGSKLENDTTLGEIWTLPCTAEVNITLKFGGKSLPVHPLDATFPFSSIGSNRTDCYGTFQAITTAANPDIDMIMGMAFLRNAYFLVNFGNDFASVLSKDGFKDVLNGTDNKQPAYIQLLSTSNDTAEIHDDFVQVRLQGKSFAELSTLKQTAKSVGKKIAKGVIIAIVVVGVLFIGLVSLCCFCFCRRRGNSKSAGSYRTLNEPAPGAAVDMHAVSYAPPAAYNATYGSH